MTSRSPPASALAFQSLISGTSLAAVTGNGAVRTPSELEGWSAGSLQESGGLSSVGWRRGHGVRGVQPQLREDDLK